MDCPSCRTELRITERQGVEIDYCPQCRGVWLDRGELDKILERSTQRAGYDRQTPEFYGQHEDRDEYRDEYRGKKKKSFLGDLFDF